MAQLALRTIRVKLPHGWTLLPNGEYVVGRDASCHITLDGPKVSRRHARFRIAEGGASVQDEGSANGVFVNGSKIGRAPQLLSDGDSVMIGDVELEIAFSEQNIGRPRLDTDMNRQTLVEVDSGDATGASTTKASALDLLASVAERALAAGDAKRAQSIIETRLNEVLRAVRDGRPVDTELRHRALASALSLAQALPAARWFDFVIDLLASAEVLPEETEWQLLEAARKSVTGIDERKLRDYASVVEKMPSTLEKLRSVRRLTEWADAARAARR